MMRCSVEISRVMEVSLHLSSNDTKRKKENNKHRFSIKDILYHSIIWRRYKALSYNEAFKIIKTANILRAIWLLNTNKIEKYDS